MSPEQFKMWRKHMGFSRREAAEALGLSASSVENYERGARREDGRAVGIPKPVELACAAIALGIRAYAGPNEPA